MTSSSSEIEIISDSPSPKPEAPIITDVFGACSYGDLAKLRIFVEKEGALLTQQDGNGYYPLQWAALNNIADALHYVIQHGGDVHAVDNVRQTALHWAAVRGSVAAVDVLLQNGARVEAVDVNGYRAVHVAAQYGQTSFLHYIVSKYHADFDVPDNEGRTPLHWAAYKGFADTIRLLLFWDANQGKQDKEGLVETDPNGALTNFAGVVQMVCEKTDWKRRGKLRKLVLMEFILRANLM